MLGSMLKSMEAMLSQYDKHSHSAKSNLSKPKTLRQKHSLSAQAKNPAMETLSQCAGFESVAVASEN